MELREYLAIRRAYSLVRQGLPTHERLTFVEYAILCRMRNLDRPMNTSEIAKYQNALRPTMTHRTKHLAQLGLIERSKGSADRRNVVCVLTEQGIAYIDGVADQICTVLRAGTVLTRTAPARIVQYIDAMGSMVCMSGDLVVLGIYQSPDSCCTISDLVATLGLLQPTVSMSVSALENEGEAYRFHAESDATRSVSISLTDAGVAHAEQVVADIRSIVVHRKS